jgi:hypothetical protein
LTRHVTGTFALNGAVLLIETVADAGVIVTAGAWIVTVAVPMACGFALLTALTVTADGLGTTAGAVYTPCAVMVPTVVFPSLIPFTRHDEGVLAVNATLAP